ncbi:MAG TPA: DUF3109 family protein [Puia sp.]|nr:DUF3109 family protein [Puia sp.]
MIAIDNILVSDSVVEEQFACDLNKCKGGCCEDGDAGAPLEQDEKDIINRIYEKVKPYMTEEGIREIEQNGFYQYDRSFGWVTPTIEGKICAYGFRNKSGIIKCAFEQAYHDGLTDWKKPISCHLYPIKIKKSKHDDIEYVNYEPREEMCHPGCVLGKKLKLPAYVFLKESLIRKYGNDFYTALEATAKHLEQQND